MRVRPDTALRCAYPSTHVLIRRSPCLPGGQDRRRRATKATEDVSDERLSTREMADTDRQFQPCGLPKLPNCHNRNYKQWGRRNSLGSVVGCGWFAFGGGAGIIRYGC